MSVFGKEFDTDWPLHEFDTNLTSFGTELLRQCLNVRKPQNEQIYIQEFINKSNEFPIKFPIDTCRVKTQPIERHGVIQQQIASAYPILHERVLFLILRFLEYKIKYGSPVEKDFYSNLSLTDFVQRLLDKRCVAFAGPRDFYLLMSGEQGYAGNDYTNVGTTDETNPLVLEDVLSYDEIKLSAFLSVSSHTELLNDGDRKNKGKIEPDFSSIEHEGVVVGIIGARFEKRFFMEYQDILITKEQNLPERGYGVAKRNCFKPKTKQNNDCNLLAERRKLWQQFYETQDFLYDQVAGKDDNPRFFSLPDEYVKKYPLKFDNVVMKKRYAITFDTLLLESQARAQVLNKQAYVYVKGIGLGNWKISDHQTKIFLECFMQRVKYLLPQLNNIAVLYFSWFDLQEWQDLKHNGFIASTTHPRGGIRTFLAKGNPAQKLDDEFKDMLLVISYAWDGNALSGNEFWLGALSDSIDPATACSTLISELHNPHINSAYVNGQNLQIATLKYGVLHIQDFARKVLNNK